MRKVGRQGSISDLTPCLKLWILNWDHLWTCSLGSLTLEWICWKHGGAGEQPHLCDGEGAGPSGEDLRSRRFGQQVTINFKCVLQLGFRDDFIEFARKSSSVKVQKGPELRFVPKYHFSHQEYVEKGKIGVGGGAVSTGAVHNLDKAELAFKVSNAILCLSVFLYRVFFFTGTPLKS